MNQGNQEIQSYNNTYQHILKYSYQMLSFNPMITQQACAFWEDKQNIIRGFVNHLAFDLNIKT